MMVSRVLLFYLCCFVLFLFFPQGIAELLEKKNPRRDFFKVIMTTPALVCILSLVVPATVKKTSLMGIVCHSFTFFVQTICSGLGFTYFLHSSCFDCLCMQCDNKLSRSGGFHLSFIKDIFTHELLTMLSESAWGFRTSSTQAGDNLIQTCC